MTSPSPLTSLFSAPALQDVDSPLSKAGRRHAIEAATAALPTTPAGVRRAVHEQLVAELSADPYALAAFVVNVGALSNVTLALLAQGSSLATPPTTEQALLARIAAVIIDADLDLPAGGQH